MDMCCGPWQELPGKGGDYSITVFVWFQLGPPIFLGMDGTWSVFDLPYLTGTRMAMVPAEFYGPVCYLVG